ncbi:MAG: 1-deoxy-D-xylulose-5-phosphate reductoisomerase [Acidiferrobacterales bacterium]|nr:1-deoxy-D-xylulose-5-phosphate reductoisomerase [Acidiferrobacterales bacterium]
MRTILILGATGSIGQQALDVVRLHPDRFRVCTLTARTASETLLQSCDEFRPDFVVVGDQDVAGLESQFKDRGIRAQVVPASELKHCQHLFDVDITVTGVSGAAGLHPTLQAVRAGKTVLVANKEPVVMLGPMLHQEVRRYGTTILPVDSEHNAIFQCTGSAAADRYEPFYPIPGLRRILLAGTGGPFRETDLDLLESITPEQAVSHPVWNMGAKISVDSATMMNKGLEIIEARWLFDATPNQIQVVVHPQGIVHSMVEYLDGSVIAQLGMPDMRIPIANALFWPEREASGAPFLDLMSVNSLTFEPPDLNRFPCLRIAGEVARMGGTSATVMNAANEVAVDAFLAGRIKFTEISTLVDRCVIELGDESVENIEKILELDKITREIAVRYI